MFKLIRLWFDRNFSDPQLVLMLVILTLIFSAVLLLGKMLMPVFASIVIAYLLEGVVHFLSRKGSNRLSVVLLVFLVFMNFLVFIFIFLGPLMWRQLGELIREVPNYLNLAQIKILGIIQNLPMVSEEDFNTVVRSLQREIAMSGQGLLSFSLASIPGLITLLVYLILVPMLVFFFLKDKERILCWSVSFLPQKRDLITAVWSEVDQQIGNYVRGKFWEIVIVGVVTYIAFAILNLKYALLLAVLVGLSVVIPYVGAALVTIPVAAVAYFQWGWSSEFGWLLGIYAVIQALDGNILVPLLFSEVVNLHPVAIIVAVLFFGGLWGFWGVFFAIPLATMVNAILTSWPKPEADEVSDTCVLSL
ncbi:MAG: AI-2E family transporter [Gammaproteobacteria bacterium]|nr:AI-2E family transporter [Gammaproteobacteria bacterium]